MSRRQFYKMTGSGNDFVIFDARTEAAGELAEPTVIQRMCARATGIGADGVVFLEPSDARGVDFRMRYLNSDGSPARMCGNAALCVARLATELGAGSPHGMRFDSESGVIEAKLVGGKSEVRLAAVSVVRPDARIPTIDGERRIGFTDTGVPHLVVLTSDASAVDVVARGRALRRDPSLSEGANVNFVSSQGDAWAIRTYERGVEGETLACGTGAVAAAVLLTEWGDSAGETELRTRSGRCITVRLERDGERWLPTLRGEGRLVFEGRLGDL